MSIGGRPATARAAMLEQNYRVRREVCSKCIHFRWKPEVDPDIKRLWPDQPARWKGHMIEKGKRCGLGNFSVKSTATCDKWEPNEQAAPPAD